MKRIADLRVGDTVWWSDVNAPGIAPGKVTKVGRKLIEVSHGRHTRVFRMDTGRTNDAYGHQTLISDIDTYSARARTTKAYNDLRRAIGWHTPDGVTEADVREAARLLRVELK